jgi:transposase
MFEDEARFGRINSPNKCWTDGERPVVYNQIVREYTYVYSAICPFDGTMDSLIIPYANSGCMSIFLDEVSRRHADKIIIMFGDGASWHTSGILKIPENIVLLKLPAYSPNLNPVENIWDELREKWFCNWYFDSLDEVDDRLMTALAALENDADIVKSISLFHWINTVA